VGSSDFGVMAFFPRSAPYSWGSTFPDSSTAEASPTVASAAW
jgi:hypothetical protein